MHGNSELEYISQKYFERCSLPVALTRIDPVIHLTYIPEKQFLNDPEQPDQSM